MFGLKTKKDDMEALLHENDELRTKFSVFEKALDTPFQHDFSTHSKMNNQFMLNFQGIVANIEDSVAKLSQEMCNASTTSHYPIFFDRTVEIVMIIEFEGD